MGDIEQRIKALGIELPRVKKFSGHMLPAKRYKNLLYTSGVGPFDVNGNPLWLGKVGRDLSVEEGYQAARQCGIVVLGVLKDYLGDLNKIESIVRVLGFVTSDQDFYQQQSLRQSV
jgi:enamine deaminase RidA (YjgF/YER057c/UK114 family)